MVDEKEEAVNYEKEKLDYKIRELTRLWKMQESLKNIATQILTHGKFAMTTQQYLSVL